MVTSSAGSTPARKTWSADVELSAKRFGRAVIEAARDLHQRLATEFFACRIGRFGDAVAVQHHQVADFGFDDDRS